MNIEVSARVQIQAAEILNAEVTRDHTPPRHFISVCTRCRGRRGTGEQLAARLTSLLCAQPDDDFATGFRLAEVNCMAGCGRSLTIAFSAAGKATYVFGDIEPDRDALHLLAFARLYHSLSGGWCNEGERPPGG